jgi:hypothetical protein
MTTNFAKHHVAFVCAGWPIARRPLSSEVRVRRRPGDGGGHG